MQQLVQLQQGVQQQQRRWHSRLNRPGFLQPQHGEQQQGVQQLVLQQLGWQQVGLRVGSTGRLAGPGSTEPGRPRRLPAPCRQRLTHTSTGTQVLTRLHTVQGTHSVTVYGTQQVTV